MPSIVESIEISKFDPSHPLLSPESDQRPFPITSVGVFAVLGTRSNLYLAVSQGQLGWSIPAGRVESTDRDPLFAAIREFAEETEGGVEERDFTHMGIVTRRSPDTGTFSRSLILRAEIDLYNVGITHYMDANQIIAIGGDQEVGFIMLRPIEQMLPTPIYRPDLNVPVVRAFSQIAT